MLLLDSGNFSDNPTTAGERKTRGLLQAMERLGYRVVNVGERDIRMGYSEFVKNTRDSGLTFVSSNLVDRKTKQPIFQPHAIVELAEADGGEALRIGVVGALRFNPRFLKAGPDGGNMVILPPQEQVRREVAALREKKVDLVVLLAALHRNDALLIARQVAGIDYVLGSYGGLVTAGTMEGDTAILYCGNKGQRIGESRVFLAQGDGPAIANRIDKLHTLSRNYPPDREMLEWVDTLRPAPTPARPAPAAGSPRVSERPGP